MIMEATGLIIGIAGLAGLFSACKEAVDQVDSYRHFGSESRQIMAQFEASKFLFQRWADHVGITNNNFNNLKELHHTSLDNVGVALIRTILLSIQEILKNTDGTSSTLQLELHNSNPLLDPTHLSGSLQTRPTTQGRNFAPVTKKSKISWALRKKTKFSGQVEAFGKLVGNLYSIVPIPEPCEVSDPDLKQWFDKLGHSLNGI